MHRTGKWQLISVAVTMMHSIMLYSPVWAAAVYRALTEPKVRTTRTPVYGAKVGTRGTTYRTNTCKPLFTFSYFYICFSAGCERRSP